MNKIHHKSLKDRVSYIRVIAGLFKMCVVWGLCARAAGICKLFLIDRLLTLHFIILSLKAWSIFYAMAMALGEKWRWKNEEVSTITWYW